jgi:hypothetical protein
MPNITGYDDPSVGYNSSMTQLSNGMSSSAAASGGFAGMGGSVSASGVGGAIGAIGSAVGDIFSGIGDQKSAAAYDAAAEVALQNENVVKGSLVTQLSQQQRNFNLTLGAQNNQIAGAGFSGGSFVNGSGMAGSGSGYYLKRASTGQFNMNEATITAQNYLQQQGYAQQATADEQMAKQANSAATGSFIGAGFSAISAVASIAMMA